MDRRAFLGTGAAALASLAAPRLLAQVCGLPTTADRYGYGPYYLGNAPMRTVIAAPGEPGQKLFIGGTVRNCAGPVAGATLEVWQATATGCYIHRSQPGCADRGNPEVTRLWATLASDAEGGFAFETIKPGVYLNGAAYRPSHIHFRIRPPAGTPDPADVVTQLYFQGDPHIPGDYGADEPGARARTIALDFSEAQTLHGIFDVVLPGGASGLRRDPSTDPALGAFDAVVRRNGDRFRIFLPPLPAATPVEVRLADGAGRLVLRTRQAVRPWSSMPHFGPGAPILSKCVGRPIKDPGGNPSSCIGNPRPRESPLPPLPRTGRNRRRRVPEPGKRVRTGILAAAPAVSALKQGFH